MGRPRGGEDGPKARSPGRKRLRAVVWGIHNRNVADQVGEVFRMRTSFPICIIASCGMSGLFQSG